MSSRMNLKAKRELVRVVAEKYQRAGRHDKHKILEQFVAVTGYHRKHSIRLLNSTAELVAPRRTRRFRVYDEAVKQALVVLWEASDWICGKRLKALLPILVPALERHGHLDLDDMIREKLLSASASTIDRLLAEAREGESSCVFASADNTHYVKLLTIVDKLSRCGETRASWIFRFWPRRESVV